MYGTVTRPCRPTVEQVERLSWTDPLSLLQLFHDDLKTPFSLFHLIHVDLKTNFSLYHLFHVLQLVPTCAIWLYHLFFTNSLFPQIFFWVSQCQSIFRKTLLTEIFFKILSCWRGKTTRKFMSQRENKKKPKPVPSGLGEVKRDLSLCYGTSHIPTMEAFACAMAQVLYHDGACTCSTCANLCHKVGLQGREFIASRAVSYNNK